MDDPLNPYGLKISVVIAGFAGGVLRALSRNQHTFRETIASPVCGALGAGYLTEPLVHYLKAIHFPLPPDDGSNVTMHASAFLVGVSAMWISDALFAFVSNRISMK
ncbi:hypothetical protein [Pseudochrobactrum kiredjianiae]|uniref:DUF1440 domain-containing protein n=1 Tax=Pseudochrobactrum kiredjianiae TaxID=386305 RepID=A0ABW3V3Y3_9HYPH|nr:hypothetical protein [Pseudochrobactrum kiredjianiae]MDM7852691.1 hypothetical protein [Pseudochrobactrum kiredjianiae]